MVAHTAPRLSFLAPQPSVRPHPSVLTRAQPSRQTRSRLDAQRPPQLGLDGGEHGAPGRRRMAVPISTNPAAVGCEGARCNMFGVRVVVGWRAAYVCDAGAGGIAQHGTIALQVHDQRALRLDLNGRRCVSSASTITCSALLFSFSPTAIAMGRS
jgi:hypothetical protein